MISFSKGSRGRALTIAFFLLFFLLLFVLQKEQQKERETNDFLFQNPRACWFFSKKNWKSERKDKTPYLEKSALCRNRTCHRQLRRLLLYPTELRMRFFPVYFLFVYKKNNDNNTFFCELFLRSIHDFFVLKMCSLSDLNRYPRKNGNRF